MAAHTKNMCFTAWMIYNNSDKMHKIPTLRFYMVGIPTHTHIHAKHARITISSIARALKKALQSSSFQTFRVSEEGFL
jgi:hypothetical protein